MISKWLEIKKKDIGVLINLTYFKGIIGSLHYLTYSRPNIVYQVGIINQF